MLKKVRLVSDLINKINHKENSNHLVIKKLNSKNADIVKMNI
jgi:hypothetical protein